MTTLTVDYRLKDWFFDRRNLEFALERAEMRALSKIGAFLRRRARSSLRRRKTPSQPGQPPSVHSTDQVVTLKNILFGYDPHIHGVVVGPVRLHAKHGRRLGEAGTIPQLLEFGGRQLIQEWYARTDRSWQSSVWRSKRRFAEAVARGMPVRWRSARYAPRPFMGTALAAELQAGTIPAKWRGTVAA